MNKKSSPMETSTKAVSTKAASPPSFIKLAMRNMVRKGKQSLMHFALTGIALIGFLVLIAWFARPNLPN